MALGLWIVSVSSVDAQSRFGCSGLESAHVPSIEGLDGFFFEIDPDLIMSHAATDQTVDRIAALSAAFLERGTELVFVPLPTKALTLPSKLGSEAEKYGYDADLAATIYEDNVTRLTEAGVSVVNARKAFLMSDKAGQVFFKTDPRLTNHGLQTLAKAIAAPRDNWPSLEGPGYETREGEPLVLSSVASDVLQMSCLSELPFVETSSFQTVAKGADYAMEDAPWIVFAGPDDIEDQTLNFAGFLSQWAGERVSVRGGTTAFAALTAFVTSDAFRLSPPDVLIWGVPIWENLSLGADQPFREALAAIEDDCVANLDSAVAGADRLRVALGEADIGSSDTLMVDNSKAESTSAVFHFVGKDGQERSRAVVRPSDMTHSGRYYMPLTGLWDDGVSYVDIETSVADDALPLVALCRGQAE